jgi:hypothetical protein
MQTAPLSHAIDVLRQVLHEPTEPELLSMAAAFGVCLCWIFPVVPQSLLVACQADFLNLGFGLVLACNALHSISWPNGSATMHLVCLRTP